jgi:hypothetical protein
MPSKNLMIVYGEQPARVAIKVGDTFRVFAALPGKFEYEYTHERPFKSTDPPEMRHRGGEEREATRVGVFPFRCFIDNVSFTNSDGSTALAGELEVIPGP